MKLLLDQGVPRSAAAILRRAGFDAVHTGEAALAGAEDLEIIRQATLEGRIVVTLDADFHTILALARAHEPSVIRVRIEGLRAEEFCSVLENVLERCAVELEDGALISVSRFRIRIRLLPVS
jgi:predicted nuclease of predicted toxin-antitoxin system